MSVGELRLVTGVTDDFVSCFGHKFIAVIREVTRYKDYDSDESDQRE